MKVLVTGAAGYIGGGIVAALAPAMEVVGGVRRPGALPQGVALVTGDLATAELDLTGFDAVVHAAGLGHRRGVGEDIWQRENVAAAVNVARQAKAAGVKKLVLISTAHVHGRVQDGVVSDGTPPSPMDGYAESKLAAEQEVAKVFAGEVTIVRPTAVIGPQCPGNLQLLMHLLARGVPLPFGSINNRRSFIDRGDLARLVLAVLDAANPPRVVLAAHPDAISTPALIRALAAGMGVAPRLLPCPPALLGLAARAVGRAAMWQSLAGSFASAPLAARSLGWTPAKTLEKSLAETGQGYTVK